MIKENRVCRGQVGLVLSRKQSMAGWRENLESY